MNHCHKIDLSRAKAIIELHGTSRDACIPILQAVQAQYGYLPEAVLDFVAAHTEISKRQIYGVATFYGQFRFKPVGQHLIRVCHGTACHVNGAGKIRDAVEAAADVKQGETSADGKFTVEAVACLGCCSLAPVMMIGDTAYGRLDRQAAGRIIEDLRDSDE